MNTNTAILFFTFSPNKLGSIKKLNDNNSKNKNVQTALYNNALNHIKATNIPYIIVDEALQTGLHFGERYCNALELGFAKGYSNLISIGSDCPTLLIKDLITAKENLDNNINTIGGDKRGGYYLLTIQKKHYSRSLFLNLNWQTKQLFNEVIKIYSFGILVKLNKKIDLNFKADINFLFKEVSGFIKLLRTILTKVNFAFKSFLTTYTFTIFKTKLLRGPPHFEL